MEMINGVVWNVVMNYETNSLLDFISKKETINSEEKNRIKQLKREIEEGNNKIKQLEREIEIEKSKNSLLNDEINIIMKELNEIKIMLNNNPSMIKSE